MEEKLVINNRAEESHSSGHVLRYQLITVIAVMILLATIKYISPDLFSGIKECYETLMYDSCSECDAKA